MNIAISLLVIGACCTGMFYLTIVGVLRWMKAGFVLLFVV